MPFVRADVNARPRRRAARPRRPVGQKRGACRRRRRRALCWEFRGNVEVSMGKVVGLKV